MFSLVFDLLLMIGAIAPVVWQYFISGFGHILPFGADHVLFILGLFFLCKSLPSLLLQMTLFTIAHSLALGLSIFGLFSLPTLWVEVTIALSISFIAVECLVLRDRLSVWRPWVVIGFGLIHGLGFSHSFRGIPIAPAHLLPALFSFNMGIEIGQLVVIGIAVATVGTLKNREWYFSRVTQPVCISIALTGLILAFQRMI